MSLSEDIDVMRPRRQVERDDVAVANGGNRSAGRGFRCDVAGHQAMRGAREAAIGHQRD